MMRAPPRTNFNRSRLVRTLAGLTAADGADGIETGPPLAERLGQWLGVTDAIALFSVLEQGAVGPATGRSGVTLTGHAKLRAEFEREKTALVNAICGHEGRGDAGSDGGRVGRPVRIKSPLPASGAPEDAETPADFSPYLRYYFAQQRAMAVGIEALRGRARATLTGCSPRLRQLAELDAMFDRFLAERERNLLATVPLLLEKRFEALHQAHRQAPDGSRQARADVAGDPGSRGQAGDPDAPGRWQARFFSELQDVLLAELELRLQPVLGLVEAHERAAE